MYHLIKNRIDRFSQLVSNTKRYSQDVKENKVSDLLVQQLGIVTTIGFNLPDVKNVINRNTIAELKRALELFERNDTSNVAVLYGIGGNFCKGLEEEYQDHPEEVSQIIKSLSYPLSQKIVVAGVSGYAVAAGFELSLLCDLRVIEETAVIGFGDSKRVDRPCSPGTCAILYDMVGSSVALDLLLTGSNMTGSRAFDVGLSNRLVGCGTGTLLAVVSDCVVLCLALGQSINLAKSIAKFQQTNLLADRNKLYELLKSKRS